MQSTRLGPTKKTYLQRRLKVEFLKIMHIKNSFAMSFLQSFMSTYECFG